MKTNQKISIQTILNGAAILVTAFFVVRLGLMLGRIFADSLALSSYNEVRDYVCYRLSHLILEGKNPYSFNMLSDLPVPFMDLYTPFIPLLVCGLCKVTGMSILASNYVVNLILVAVTVFFLWQIQKSWISANRPAAFLSLVLIASTFFALFLTAVPLWNGHADTAGICVTAALYYVAQKHPKRTWLLAALTVFLIFTKQILLLLALPMFLYLMIVEVRTAFSYFWKCLGFGILVVAVMQVFFPLYWTETIYAQFFALSTDSSLYFALYNLAHCFLRYAPLVVCTLAGAVVYIVRDVRSHPDLGLFARIVSWCKRDSFTALLVLNLLVGIPALLVLAQNSVDGYKYCQDIIGPNLYLLACFLWYKIGVRDSSLVTCAFSMAAVLCVLAFPTTRYTDEEVQAYRNLDQVIAEHEGETLYLGMNSTQYMAARDLWEPENIYFNDGHMEFFHRQFTDNELINRFFYNEEITAASDRYVQEMNEMVKQRRFGLVAVCGDLVIDGRNLDQYYTCIGTYPIKNETNGSFDVMVWVPKD